MMMIVGGFVAVMLMVMLATPDAPLARLLHAAIILPLAAGLTSVRRCYVLLTVIAVVCVWIVGAEGIQLAAMAMPELAAWAALVDLGVLLDVGVTLIAAATITPLRSLAVSVCSRRNACRPRSRRSLPIRRDHANDDDSEDRSSSAA